MSVRRITKVLCLILVAGIADPGSAASAASRRKNQAKATYNGLTATFTFGKGSGVSARFDMMTKSIDAGDFEGTREDWLGVLRGRETEDRYTLNLAMAGVGFAGVVATELVRAAKRHRPISVGTVLADAALGAVAGFALAAPFSPGPTNYTISTHLTEALARWVSIRVLSGRYGRLSAGDVRANLAVALGWALGARVMPAELDRWIPCQSSGLASDVCNSVYELVWLGMVQQGAQEAIAAMLDRAVSGNDRDPENDGIRAYLNAAKRGGVFGALDRTAVLLAFGPQQYLSDYVRERVARGFDAAGLGEEAQDCILRSVFRHGGLWSLMTPKDELSFNMGGTTMGDVAIYGGSRSVDDYRAHEVGGHCTQYLNEGYFTFLLKYGLESIREGTTASYDESGICQGNSFECEAYALEQWFNENWDED